MQNFRALGAPPPDPRASGGWGLCPQTPSLRQLGASPPDPHWPPAAGKQPPPLRISGYAPGYNNTIINNVEKTKYLAIVIDNQLTFGRFEISLVLLPLLFKASESWVVISWSNVCWLFCDAHVSSTLSSVLEIFRKHCKIFCCLFILGFQSYSFEFKNTSDQLIRLSHYRKSINLNNMLTLPILSFQNCKTKYNVTNNAKLT